MKNKAIYKLSTKDVQQVAKENYGRELTADELEKLIEPIGDSIPWYETIDDAIGYLLKLKRVD